MIQLHNIEMKYKQFTLGPINLEINKSEFISVIGPSGSGKSTLIKIITNFENATSGLINYNDVLADDILYISQKGTTFNHLTIRKNLNLKHMYTDVQIIAALNRVGLKSEFIDKYPYQLSGGERQRIDLARAVLSKAKLIILDESMSALDKKNKDSITLIIKDIVASTEASVIYITHDEKQASKYSSRTIEIADGKVISDKKVGVQ